uniref:Uncharacterized protein n=1 Tax=Amphimedon queenslandica TaxID=400682 RepID=A0A1X7TB48_AMPQE
MYLLYQTVIHCYSSLGEESLIISTALSRSLYSGNSGFKEVYRKELLEHLKTDPLLQDLHDAGMADTS